MTWRVLISAPYMLPVLDRFGDLFRQHDIALVIAPVVERLEEDELLRLVPGIHGVICGDDRFTARVMNAADQLRVICKWGTGVDSIDVGAAKAQGIRVCRTPNAFSEPVADFVIGYFLAFARNIPFMDKQLKSGKWEKIPGRALNESTIGVIGVGDVGKAVLRRAKPFGAVLLGTDIREVDQGFIEEVGVTMTNLEELLRKSDFVSINCDLNPASYHLMNDETLALLKRGAVLVNTARGPIVEEQALARALESGHLLGAGLDVFESEPLPAHSPLRKFDNCLIAPHNSNSSPRAWDHVHKNTLAMLIRELNTVGER